MTILFILLAITAIFMAIMIVDDIEQNNLWFDNEK